MPNTDSAVASLFNSIAPLSDDILAEIIPHVQHITYPKSFILLNQGQVCKHIWFMTKGAVKYYYITDEGKEVNTWFSLDVQVIADTVSIVSKQPSSESISLLEDSEFYIISYEIVQQLLHKYHAFALWFIKLLEKYYILQIEDRVTDLQFLDAKQRYQKLLEIYPDIINRVSLGNIASYLNISQETLSRIRSGRV